MSAVVTYNMICMQGASSSATNAYTPPATPSRPLTSRVKPDDNRVLIRPLRMSTRMVGHRNDCYSSPASGEQVSCTQPATRRWHRRGASMPLPPQISNDVEIVIHPLLQQCPGNIDLRQPWERVRADWDATLDEVATNPLIPSLAITSRLLQWPIVVQRSEDRAYVTVGDVLRTMWTFFQIPLSYESIPGSASFGTKRMRMSGKIDSSESYYQQGAACRVDLMMGQTSFVGLSKARGETDTWVLRVASGF